MCRPTDMKIGYTNAAGAPAHRLRRPLTRNRHADLAARRVRGRGRRLSGKAVLIRRGTCGSTEVAEAPRMQAPAVLLYNNAGGGSTRPSRRPGPQRRRSRSRRRDLGRGRRPIDGPIAAGPRRSIGPPDHLEVLNPPGGTDLRFSSYGLERSSCQAGHRRAGRTHPLDLPARGRGVRGCQRHIDGLAPCRRRGGITA